MTRIHREIHAFGVALGLLLAGCATVPAPVGLLDDAERAVESARAAQADHYAAVELGQAEEQLTAARLAMEERDYPRVRELAQRAELDAELAQARSRAASGREKVRAGTEENARLRRELLGGNR